MMIHFFSGPVQGRDIEAAGKLYEAEQYNEAYIEFENVYVEDSNDMAALCGMAWCKFKTGKLEKAQAMFKSILRKQPYHPGATQGLIEVNEKIYGAFNAAWALHYAKDYDGAVAAFQSILDDRSRLMPEKELWRVFLSMGQTCYKKNDPEQATLYFKNSLDLLNNSDAHKGIGLILFDQKDYGKAVEAFILSLALYPDQYDVASLIAWCQFRNKDTKAAITGFEKQIAINPYIADAHYGLGLALNQQGEKKPAMEQFYSVISLLPGYLLTDEFYTIIESNKEYEPLYVDLGWALYFSGLFKESLFIFEKGLASDPDNAVLLRGAGYASYFLGDYDKAILYCKTSLSKDDQLIAVLEANYSVTGLMYKFYSDARSTMGWAHFQKKEYDKAMTHFNETIRLHPQWPDPNNGLGWIYYSQKKYNEAEKAFNAALALDPAYNDAYNGLTAVSTARTGRSGDGWKYYYLSQFDKALEEFKRIAAQKNITADEKQSAERGLGWSNLKLGNHPASEMHFNALIKQNSKDYDAVLGLGYAQYEKKEYSNALSSLKIATEGFPLDVNAAVAYGWSFYHTGKFNESLAEFQRAAGLYPSLAEPYRGIGYSLVKLGKTDEGKLNIIAAINIFPKVVDNDVFTELVKAEPSLKELYITLAWSCYNFALYQDALRHAELIDVEYPDLDMLLGFIYFGNKQYNDSAKFLEKFLSGAPKAEKGYGKYSDSFYNLGWSYYYLNNYSKAIEIFEKFSRLHRDDDIWAAPYDGMGWNYMKMGNKSEAEAFFKESLKRAPGFLNSLAGLKELKQ